MFSVNLKKELEAAAAYSVSAVAEHLLVDDPEASVWFVNTCLLQERQIKKQKQFLKQTYSEEQVRAICIKYRLRCLPVNLFRGVMDAQVPAKKVSFESEYKEILEEKIDPRNYRIVAPSELFSVAYGNLDPLLLYRFTHQGNIYYKFVHQWGGDLNRWRALANYPLRSMNYLSMCTFLVWLAVIFPLCLILPGLSMSSAIFVSIFLLTGSLLCVHSFFTNRHGQSQTSDRIWDSQPVI
ncbi:hypothetical protein GXP67_31845 [Rhodocytophaga rosea]|uniref:Uncharacterized protein n=1 Tax=Rhodocytophaga rosea TaxID=2704465 RepID=A0A6C0GS40_9BACT|nr:hypothetical protein [Rhodocytophaga rosea]QHT70915.1 hypothetical protein GXP67_31845 [Rhodocytophaga rosea]